MLHDAAATSHWWADEAAVFTEYWDSPRRTRATDLLWLRRQCYKELFDGVVPRVRELEAGCAIALPALTREIQEEAAHFDAFAAVYDEFRSDADPPLSGEVLRASNWPENVALGEMRARHRRDHGVVGALASALTEGGGCTLFTSGMARRGRGGIDDAIASACERVFEDERRHVSEGFSAVSREQLSLADEQRLSELVAEQSRARVAMRSAQFSHLAYG